MKFRVVVSLLGFASLFAVAAQAQEERKTIDVFAGYSYVRDNPSTPRANSFSLNGGNASVAYNFKNWLSGVADFGGYHNTNILGSGGSDTLSTYLFGPRVSYRRFGRITPFGQVLFGVAHTGRALLGNRFGEMLKLRLQLCETLDRGLQPPELFLDRRADLAAFAHDMALQLLKSAHKNLRQAIRQLACHVCHRLLVHFCPFLHFWLLLG